MANEHMPDNYPMTYRLVVCLDVDAKDLKEAYRKVYLEMKKVDAVDFQWESSDEWFEPGGDLGDPDKLQGARMAVFDEENADEN